MSNEPGARWIVLVPAAPLLVSLAAVPGLYTSGWWEVLATVVLTKVFPFMPLFGVATLVYLCWGWRKGWVELRRPHVLAAVALSLLDIVIPLGLLLYILWALRGARLTF